MARKTFEDNHRITFTSDPNAPRMPSLIPEMTCDEASEQFGILEAGGRVPLGHLLRLMKHLASDELPHPASCPFHRAGSLDQARRHFDERMEGGD